MHSSSIQSSSGTSASASASDSQNLAGPAPPAAIAVTAGAAGMVAKQAPVCCCPMCFPKKQAPQPCCCSRCCPAAAPSLHTIVVPAGPSNTSSLLTPLVTAHCAAASPALRPVQLQSPQRVERGLQEQGSQLFGLLIHSGAHCLAWLLSVLLVLKRRSLKFKLPGRGPAHCRCAGCLHWASWVSPAALGSTGLSP